MVRILATRGRALLTDVTAESLPPLLEDPEVRVWVDLSGPLDDSSRMLAIEVFHFHPLAIEDCFEERERPKLETYDGYLYCITHGIGVASSAEEHEIIELDAFLGRRYLVTYHARESRSVDSVLEAVGRSGEPLRRGPASLLHAILDRQVDGIEPVLDNLEERLGELESQVLANPRSQDLASLVGLRRNILHLRRWLGLQRDVVLRLARQEFDLVSSAEALLFRDTHDHLARFTEFLETYRELTNSIQEAYLSVINNRLGENMRFLTLFSAVLLPMTLIAGIYGMNFEHMPGLHHGLGFSLALLAMGATAGLVLLFFRRKGWLGKRRWTVPMLAAPTRRDRKSAVQRATKAAGG
jgi:magnesium transporter